MSSGLLIIDSTIKIIICIIKIIFLNDTNMHIIDLGIRSNVINRSSKISRINNSGELNSYIGKFLNKGRILGDHHSTSFLIKGLVNALEFKNIGKLTSIHNVSRSLVHVLEIIIVIKVIQIITEIKVREIIPTHTTRRFHSDIIVIGILKLLIHFLLREKIGIVFINLIISIHKRLSILFKTRTFLAILSRVNLLISCSDFFLESSSHLKSILSIHMKSNNSICNESYDSNDRTDNRYSKGTNDKECTDIR